LTRILHFSSYKIIGERDGVTKIIFLITDGKQNPKQSADGKFIYDPVVASKPLIDRGNVIQALTPY